MRPSAYPRVSRTRPRTPRLIAACCWVAFAAALTAAGPTYELDARLVPARAAQVSVYGSTFPFTAVVIADERGFFKVRGLKPGTYTVSVVDLERGQASRTVYVGAGTSDSKRRVKAVLEFQPSEYELGDVQRETASVSLKKLAISPQARKEFQAAERAQGRYQTAVAIEHLKRAVALAPQFSAAWNNLGTIAYHERRLSDAEECFRKAIESDPESFAPLVNLGGALIDERKLDEAYTVNLRALLARPNDVLANSQMGMVYYYLNRFELAARYFDIARKGDPAHFSHPQLFLATIYGAQKEYAKAADMLSEFLVYHPDYSAAAALRQDIAGLRARVVGR